jgi:RecA/RadA recombinase
VGLRLHTLHDGFNYITGGLPQEGITNLWGRPSSGKTAIARMIVRDLSRTKPVLAYPTDTSLYGQDGDHYILREPNYELGLSQCLDWLADGGVVIIDELSPMFPNSPATGATGRMIAHFLQTAKLVMSDTGGALIITSQVRKEGGAYAYQNPVSAYVDMEVRLKQKEAVNDDIGDRIGRWTLLDVKRNRELRPHTKGRLFIRVQKAERGMTPVDGLIDGAFLRGDIHISGTWWNLAGTKAQGRENLYRLLRESHWQPSCDK